MKPDTPMCWMYLGGKKTYALVDTGADISLISRETFDKLAAKNIFEFSTKNCVPLQSVSGQKLKNFGTAELRVKMSKFDQIYKFQIIEGMNNQCILGNDFLSDFGAQLDFGQKTLNLEGNVIPLRPQKFMCASVTSLVRTSQKITISAHSYVEIPAKVNRAPLIEQECLIQPLNNMPIFRDEPGLSLVSSVGKVTENRQIPVVIVNATGRDYTLPAYSVIGLAEVLDETEKCISSVSETADSDDFEDVQTTPETKKENLSHVSAYQRQQLRDMLDRNADLFAESDCDLGCTDRVKAKIDTGDHNPIKQNPYRLPFSQRQLVQEHIDKMLQAGVISPSQSPWASPIVIVDKKDGSKRFCVDLRGLNRITKKNSHPLPRIDDILASLDGSQYFSCLDLRSGYWQIPMDEDSKEKTAFTCFAGLYQWEVMPFGMVNAPAIFSELMNDVLRGIQYKFTIAYLDDILIYSKTFEEHVEHVEAVFTRLRDARLKLKMSKCEFLKKEVNYLGHIVSPSGIKPDQSKVEAIAKLGPPTDVRGIRSFIGMTGYYRRFIANYAKIAKPLTELTKKNRRFYWNEDCQRSFETLRRALTEAPILAFPDINKPYKLYTDASNYAIGAALVQETEMGERVIQYLSHQLNETQQRWPIIEKEAYAIVYGIQKLRPYLLGSKFTVMTDHKPLKHLFTSEMRNARIQRWAIMLDEYGCDIEYVSGSKNVVADMLSRIGPVEYDDVDRDDVVTSESLPVGPANYAGRIKGDVYEHRVDRETDAAIDESMCDIYVIDSDHAPGIQLRSEVETCTERDQTTKEKFKEFLENHHDFQKVQSDDPEIQRIVNILGDTSNANHVEISRHYIVEDGLLYRITDTSKCIALSGIQLVIPKFLQQSLIEEIHSGYFGGHLGIDKTYEKIRSRYYWSGMYRDVVQFLKTCLACNMRKLRRERPPLQDMQIPKYPFEQVAIDTSGPFPESYNGNRYIINVIDLFSGWPESFATKSKSAETVGQILIEHIIPRHACPRVLVSDNGTEFCNAVVDQISAFFNIKHIRTSIYHPSSNGKCERYNRVQNDMIAKLVDPSQRDWDTKIPSILSAYRTAKNETTKFSPFYIMYGRDPVLPVDTLLAPKYRYQGSDYVPIMLENLHTAYHQVQHNLSSGHERNKVYYDRKAKPVNFTVGDMVYFRDPTEAAQQSKLASHWKPYYRIIKALSKVTFVIKNQLSGGTKVVNAHNLRLADPQTRWENYSDEPTHINSKYENKQKSSIPVRVQPPRRSKFSVAFDDDSFPMRRTESESETVPSSTLEIPVPELPSIQENLPNLPSDDSEAETMSSDEDAIPLAKLKEQWDREKAQDEIEENLPLSELSKQLASKPPESGETPSVSVKRPLIRDESPPSDSETRCPPDKFSRHSLSDVESDFSESEADRKYVGACQSINVTNPSAIKTELLSSMMEAHKHIMEKMLSQLEKL